MPEPIAQAAAIPFRDGRICLVTSRNGSRWVLPKGRIDPGQTAIQAAEVEAWEEAGLIGNLLPEAVGSYRYEKLSRKYLVSVFVMEVTVEHPTWPEYKFRTREWLSIVEALKLIHEPSLRAILRTISDPGEILGPPIQSVSFLRTDTEMPK
jgi:8-oxo-dGTP pyrophosphatase MutT (NUDIX family)